MLETMTIGVSLTSSAEESLPSRRVVPAESLVRRALLLVLTLTLLAIAADQLAAPILHTYTPLWATAACLLLVLRRGEWRSAFGDGAFEQVLSKRRLAVFFAAHFLLILLARWMTSTIQPLAGTPTAGGIVISAAKLTVLLVPTLVLLPLSRWRELIIAYRPEIVVALVVFITYSPWRTAEAIWPWYGQLLGRFVYALARFAVPGMGYVSGLTPTLTGPDLDITIFQGCSGLNGFELFGYLFGVVTFLDWNRLRKGRALFAYFAGLLVILVGNALRITSYVVLGNHGFADFVLRFHLSAGWIFFSVIFLAYLSLTYRWMLKKKNAELQPQQAE